MASKIKLKIDQIEFEYEGDAAFSHDAIIDIFSHMETLLASRSGEVTPPDGTPAANAVKPMSNGTSLHTSSIAARMNGKSASDLAIASAAHLQLVKGKDVFTRHELIADMKSAPTIFKKNMVSNLSTTITTLVGNGAFNQVSKDTYSLSASKKADMEKIVVE